MEDKIEITIGQRLITKDKAFECVEDEASVNACFDCAFSESILCTIFECRSSFRKDGKRVHFKTVELDAEQ